MKAYTDLEQSKKLAEILPVESADMCYRAYEEGGILDYQATLFPYQFASWVVIPCWSLAALLKVMPKQLGIYTLTFYWCDDSWCCSYIDDGSEIKETSSANNPVDATVEMIVKLKEKELTKVLWHNSTNTKKESIKSLCINEAYLFQWYQSSVDANPPIWTDEHLKELFKDFYLIPKNNIEI